MVRQALLLFGFAALFLGIQGVGIDICGLRGGGGKLFADVSQCNLPGASIPSTAVPVEDVITVITSENIEDVEVFVDITHDWIGDLIIDVTHPSGSQVRLHDELGGDADNIFISYRAFGAPNGSLPYDSGCAIQPGGITSLDDFVGLSTDGAWTLSVADTFAGGAQGTVNEWCVNTWNISAPVPNVPIQGLTCSSVGGTGVADLSWTNPVTYDFIDVVIDGAFAATLPGDAETYSTPQSPFPDTIQVCIQGYIGAAPSCVDTCCNILLPQLPADLLQCSSPDLFIPYPAPAVSDTIDVTTDFTIADLQVQVDITHEFVGDVVIDVLHAGTSVRLTDESGGAGEDFDLTYWDLGIDNNAEPYNCGCLMQPTGPGGLSDFVGVSTLGAWTLQVQDTFTGQHENGNFNSWCVLAFETGSVGSLQCNTTSGSQDVAVSWSNTSTYDEINLYVNGVLFEILPGNTESYILLGQAVPSDVEICVEPITVGTTYPQVCCIANLAVDPVLDPDCTSVSGTGIATVTWELPAIPLDSINIYVNQVLEASLAGDAVTYTTLPAAPVQTLEVSIEGVLNGFGSALIPCNVPILDIVDAEVCSTTPLIIGTGTQSTTIDMASTLIIGDLQVLVDLRHDWVGDLNIDVSSPAGTEIRLHAEDAGGDADDLFVVYDDLGIANDVPYTCGCLMQPIGPGVMADVAGESAAGLWTLQLEDTFPNADGFMQQWCVRIIAGCQTPAPTGLFCSPQGDDLNLTWINGGTYSEISVIRDGVVINTIPGTATDYLDVAPPPGLHSYQVTGIDGVQACGNVSNSCNIAVGVTDVIFRGEEPGGNIDSAAALELALLGIGRNPIIVDTLTNGSINSGGRPEILWLCLGTFPNERDLTAAEGQLLAQLHTGDFGLNGTVEETPMAIYVEGADVWGFSSPTLFEQYDGVENASFGNTVNGDDSLNILTGIDSGLGVDMSTLSGGVYAQDSTGNDFTDRLVPCDLNPDLGGANAAAIWSSTAPAPAYNVGVYYASTIAPVISQSWEIGGYGGAAPAVVAAYVDALTNPPLPPSATFTRGDANGDGAFSGLVDGVFVLNYQFVVGAAAPPCFDAADANDDGSITGLIDGLYLLNYQFQSGAAPPAPGLNCGADPTPDTLDCLMATCP